MVEGAKIGGDSDSFSSSLRFFSRDRSSLRNDLFVIQVILHLIFSEVTYEHCIKDSTTIEIKVPRMIQFSDCLVA